MERPQRTAGAPGSLSTPIYPPCPIPEASNKWPSFGWSCEECLRDSGVQAGSASYLDIHAESVVEISKPEEVCEAQGEVEATKPLVTQNQRA